MNFAESFLVGRLQLISETNSIDRGDEKSERDNEDEVWNQKEENKEDLLREPAEERDESNPPEGTITKPLSKSTRRRGNHNLSNSSLANNSLTINFSSMLLDRSSASQRKLRACASDLVCQRRRGLNLVSHCVISR